MARNKALLFWPVLLAVTATDAVTKALAERWLPLPQLPHEVLGNAVRFTLVYNPGAAFGINFGPSSRWIFM
ncbi:MAG TPA: signal peptidase II, partial [Gemmatimonadaceae bacterium]